MPVVAGSLVRLFCRIVVSLLQRQTNFSRGDGNYGNNFIREVGSTVCVNLLLHGEASETRL